MMKFTTQRLRYAIDPGPVVDTMKVTPNLFPEACSGSGSVEDSELMLVSRPWWGADAKVYWSLQPVD